MNATAGGADMTRVARAALLTAMTLVSLTPAIADTRDTVLFICEHGSVKSMLAATLFERAAVRERLAVRSVSRGTAPDATIPAWLRSAMEAEQLELGSRQPRKLSGADLASAKRIVVFDISLPSAVGTTTPVDRWDGLPSVSKDYRAGRDAIAAKVEELVRRLKARRTAPRDSIPNQRGGMTQ
jgi:arsenate reductase (thioredoxin)